MGSSLVRATPTSFGWFISFQQQGTNTISGTHRPTCFQRSENIHPSLTLTDIMTIVKGLFLDDLSGAPMIQIK